ncbi:hypothetical protein CEUSTIGMA_g10441.t1 [Chlamydomonas eustigma]|uniref:RING-type E3 ubiquitin transferase n=1 Tax=Chlamydomonas eustigma TaxID=1157962 RepID=A0A250XIV9_9CHLO|nr:hypothetical protein CEUSTIGMA_g10441.t1 [Chlamydomonas eustigma]|eukprot:GAX83014.1 hypothetical protein CEUSTIGMA_g10441.t1 [Chlamydomonas eustigma]
MNVESTERKGKTAVKQITKMVHSTRGSIVAAESDLHVNGSDARTAATGLARSAKAVSSESIEILSGSDDEKYNDDKAVHKNRRRRAPHRRPSGGALRFQRLSSPGEAACDAEVTSSSSEEDDDSEYDPEREEEEKLDAKDRLRSCTSSAGNGAATREEALATKPGHGCSTQEDGVVGSDCGVAGSKAEVTKTTAIPPTVRAGYSTCPVCGVTLRSALVNSHLDICISKQERKQQGKGTTSITAPHGHSSSAGHGIAAPLSFSTLGRTAEGTAASTTASRIATVNHDVNVAGVSEEGPSTSGRFLNSSAVRAISPQPCKVAIPPKLVFNLISDKELKKKMNMLGLPTDGKKQDWVDRYQAYRRFLQVKIDEGLNYLSAGQLLGKFLAQQRQQDDAKRSAPRLPPRMVVGVPTSSSDPPSSMTAATAAAAAAAAGYSHEQLLASAMARMPDAKRKREYLTHRENQGCEKSSSKGDIQGSHVEGHPVSEATRLGDQVDVKRHCQQLVNRNGVESGSNCTKREAGLNEGKLMGHDHPNGRVLGHCDHTDGDIQEHCITSDVGKTTSTGDVATNMGCENNLHQQSFKALVSMVALGSTNGRGAEGSQYEDDCVEESEEEFICE